MNFKNTELGILLQKKINTYLNLSMPLCTIMSNEVYQNWFYEHFINVFSLCNENKNVRFYFLEDEYFYKDVAEQQIVTAKELENVDIEEYIINKIDEKNYMIIFVDEFYLPGKYAFNNYTFVHQILVYGYDKYNYQFFTIGFDDEQNFRKMKYSFKQIVEAYEKGKKSYSEQAPWTLFKTIELIKLKELSTYEFDVTKFTSQLADYLNGYGDINKIPAWDLTVFGNKITFGINVYKQLYEHLILHKNNLFTIDYRYLHLFFEQKNSIYTRLQYVYNNKLNNKINDSILNEYEKLVQEADVSRLTYYKHIMYENNFHSIHGYLKNIEAIDEISKIVHDVYISEYKLLQKII